ncbi:23S rRNA (pseudouridine(1915)-N(3))-methyltransferase RlmH [Victivallis sp. Marseille-Q1083]|uniref:23S rRNA (pseudouridine(1915)-N(3))-methyltransferase RlmH n=1 Tax=Victivallis sp. Marseille-Q1083 TaxID=2717288 RepID=UPI0015882BA9|nr:23S rRNA (pseudouridine(1915)-N(3))-methyltransferase RlmH [Victivallis sp. Marseille-Q1083]
MLFKLISIGRFKDRHLQAKAEEFLKWLSPYAKVELLELRDSTKEKESQAILKALDKSKEFVIVLSEEGRECTSVEFAGLLNRIDRKITFVIGGPYGMTPELKAQADLLLSLSKLTFTHEMARLFLLEQLYRAISITNGGKYHNI